MLVGFEQRGGHVVHVNPDYVSHIEVLENGRRTAIFMNNGREIWVEEKVSYVSEKLNQATQSKVVNDGTNINNNHVFGVASCVV